MRDLARDAHFAVEAGKRSSIQYQLFGQEFERHILVQLQIFGAINLAHTAAANESHNAVAVRQQSARKNAAAFSAQGSRTAARRRGRWRG